MNRLTYGGVSVQIPPGWDGAIQNRPLAMRELGVGSGPSTDDSHTVLHVANFPLPPQRGDFGSAAVEIMRSEHLLIVVFDYGPEAAGTVLFQHEGIPVPLDPAAFNPNMMQRPLKGQSGLQRFFTSADRGYCLYVALGSHRNRHELVGLANDVLATLELSSAA